MSRWWRVFALGVLFAVSGSLSAPCLAADDEAAARELFKRGLNHLRKGAFAEALQQFELAYEHWRNPKILLNIATTLRQLGRLPEAGDAYELYLSDPGADPAKISEVKKALAEIDAKIARVTIDVGIDGAELSVDGQKVERTKTPTTKELVRTLPFAEDQPGHWRLRLPPGERRIEVSKQGYRPASKAVTLSAGDSTTLTIELIPNEYGKLPPPHRPPPVAPRPPPSNLSHDGQLSLSTRADVDGKLRGAVAVVGAGYGVGSVVEVQVAALLGRDKGVEPGATFYLLEGTVKPLGYVGVPVFFADGASPGVHGALGLQVDPAASFGAFAHVGLATFFNVPEDRESTAFVPALGVQGRF